MGEVYKARDTRLGREVAVKVLPARTSSSPEARQRFEREAKTISRLAHPHICALYDVGNQDGVEYLVMELLDGETLSERLGRGPIALEQTLRFGQEIADALDKAHRQGIVHRDLKPANVMLTRSGVKLLDFGLAKAVEPAPNPGEVTSLPTQQGLTQEGMILGTFQYMAPEQLEGKDADPRTDIFAFGAVLYEMATGRKAFSAASQASLITAIMSADPPSILSVLPLSPSALDRVVRTCLAKDPEERWQSAADVKRELKWIGEGSASVEATAAAPRRRGPGRERAAWAVAALAVLAGAVGIALSRRPAAAPELMRFTLSPPRGHRLLDCVVLSPDGRRIALLLKDPQGVTAVWVRSLEGLGMRRLPGTDWARYPFWSPDGREVAFYADGKLKRTSAEGGPVQTICESGSGFGGAWGRDGTILFTSEFGMPIVAVASSGGTPRPVTALEAAGGEVAHLFPALLPDGRHFVFVARHLDPEKTQVKLGSLDEKTSSPLFRSDTAALYSDPGYLLFAKDDAVLARRFDPSRLQLSGDAIPAFEGARYGTEENRLSASVAAGRFAYLLWPQRRRLVWVDRKGRELSTLGDVACYEDVRVSPDGRRVAVARRDPEHGQNLDLWVLDAVRGTPARVTSERSDEFSPAWFADGERLLFVSDRGGSGFYDLYEVPATGGTAKLLFSTKQDKTAPSVSRDGRNLLFIVSEAAQYRRQMLSLPEAVSHRLGGATRFSEGHPEISPDGRWSAFNSDESGISEVYVEPTTGGPKKQVSVGGGQAAIWRADGNELFYVARDGSLMAVVLRPGPQGFDVADPQRLFSIDAGNDAGTEWFRRAYDAAPDGERFLVIRPAVDAEREDAVVVLNWMGVIAPKGPPS
jgi:eukaryotic-like serine/threonine-protein kinase